MSRELANLIEVISKLGPTSALVLFGIIVSWRALPTLLRWWAAQIKQANMVSTTIPEMNRSLQTMAASGQASHGLLEEMNRKLDLLLKRT